MYISSRPSLLSGPSSLSPLPRQRERHNSVRPTDNDDKHRQSKHHAELGNGDKSSNERSTTVTALFTEKGNWRIDPTGRQVRLVKAGPTGPYYLEWDHPDGPRTPYGRTNHPTTGQSTGCSSSSEDKEHTDPDAKDGSPNYVLDIMHRQQRAKQSQNTNSKEIKGHSASHSPFSTPRYVPHSGLRPLTPTPSSYQRFSHELQKTSPGSRDSNQKRVEADVLAENLGRRFNLEDQINPRLFDKKRDEVGLLAAKLEVLQLSLKDSDWGSILRTLEISRNAKDVSITPESAAILDNAVVSIWRRVQSQPDTYILTQEEFAVFHHFRDHFRGNAIAQRAQIRYSDSPKRHSIGSTNRQLSEKDIVEANLLVDKLSLLLTKDPTNRQPSDRNCAGADVGGMDLVQRFSQSRDSAKT